MMLGSEQAETTNSVRADLGATASEVRIVVPDPRR